LEIKENVCRKCLNKGKKETNLLGDFKRMKPFKIREKSLLATPTLSNGNCRSTFQKNDCVRAEVLFVKASLICVKKKIHSTAPL
jgi:hypothetical protein